MKSNLRMRQVTSRFYGLQGSPSTTLRSWLHTTTLFHLAVCESQQSREKDAVCLLILWRLFECSRCLSLLLLLLENVFLEHFWILNQKCVPPQAHKQCHCSREPNGAIWNREGDEDCHCSCGHDGIWLTPPRFVLPNVIRNIWPFTNHWFLHKKFSISIAQLAWHDESNVPYHCKRIILKIINCSKSKCWLASFSELGTSCTRGGICLSRNGSSRVQSASKWDTQGVWSCPCVANCTMWAAAHGFQHQLEKTTLSEGLFWQQSHIIVCSQAQWLSKGRDCLRNILAVCHTTKMKPNMVN